MRTQVLKHLMMQLLTVLLVLALTIPVLAEGTEDIYQPVDESIELIDDLELIEEPETENGAGVDETEYLVDDAVLSEEPEIEELGEDFPVIEGEAVEDIEKQPDDAEVENTEGRSEDEEAAEESAEGETAQADEESDSETSDDWSTTEIEHIDDQIDLDMLYADESAKLMEAGSVLAADTVNYQYLPSILYAGDVYDLKNCLLIDGYSPSEVVSWKSSKKKVVRIGKGGVLTALKSGRAKITVRTSDKKKRTISVSVRANRIGGLFPKPSRADAVALGEAFSIRPKSLQYSGTKLVAEFYLLNGSKKAMKTIRGLNISVFAGSRTNKITNQYFSKIKVKGKKKGVSTFKVTFSGSGILQNNVHLMNYPASQIYFDLVVSSVYGTVKRGTIPFVTTVIPNVPAEAPAHSVPTTEDATTTASSSGDATINTPSTGDNSKPSPTGISLNKTSIQVVLGLDQLSYTLKATVSPSGADSTVTWSSNKTSVATVNSSSGTVTIKGEGKATITAKTTNGKTATCVFDVINPKPNPTGVTLNKTSVQVVLGLDSLSYTLKATVSPSNADNTVTWSSSNTSVATVSSSGKVTIKGEGKATITAKTTNGKTATCVFDVINPHESISFSVKHGSDTILNTNKKSGTAEMSVDAYNGDKYTLTVESNYSWKVSTTDASWVSLSNWSGSSGKSNLVLTVRNITGSKNYYTTDLIFEVDGEKRIVTVKLIKV